MEMPDIEFIPGVPPDYLRSRGYWVRALEPLRTHVGVWARVRGHRGRWVSQIVFGINSKLVQLPVGVFRAAQRGADLYVCCCSAEAPK